MPTVFLRQQVVQLPAGQSVSFGPFTIAETDRVLSYAILRNTSQRPNVWNDPATVIQVTMNLYFDGVLHESFSPDQFTGGISIGKDGTELDFCGASVGPLPKQCTCGERFHPGIDYSRSLLHSTLALRNGITLADVRAAIQGWTITLAQLKRRITAADDNLIDRVFHAPASASVGRTCDITVSCLSGPQFNSALTVGVI